MSSQFKAATGMIDAQDTIFVICAAIFTSLLSEGISWFLIYRHNDYKSLVQNIESIQKKIDKQKDSQLFTGGSAKNKTQEKKLSQNEGLLKQYNSDLMRGVIVAKLPFEPISLMRGVTHRNIMGSDFTDCSMIFIYILSNVSLRPIIQKVLGFAGPRTSIGGQPSFFGSQ